jgi:hypothetical protein
MKQKKTFDAVAFMRKRREELSRDYAGLSAEQMEDRIRQSLKNDPLWMKDAHKEPRHRRGRKQAAVPGTFQVLSKETVNG